MPRYLTVWVNPKTGRERLGTESQQFHTYKNIRNLIRFGLAKPGILAGQHHVYIWPEGGECGKSIFATVYKKAEVK
jgi:hypothetical protein